ncbi:MAG TPA: serine protease [Candidatus Dormibacteraeota bacterium]
MKFKRISARRRASGSALCALLCVAVVALLPLRAGALSADNPAIRQATTVAQPSVVFLYVRIQGSLLDHRDGQIHGPYVSSSKGSGFFVNANGDIVTATHVVSPTNDDVHQALVDRYIIAVTGTQLATNDPTFLAYMAATDVSNFGLDVRAVTPAMRLPGNATDDDLERLGLPATIVASSPVADLDVSVIHVNRTQQPAVLLHAGESPPNNESLALMGYPQMAPVFSTTPEVDFGLLTDVRAAGSSLPDNAGVLPRQATVIVTSAFSEHGVSGGPGVDAQAHVVGLVSFGADAGTPIFLVSADDISGVLTKAGVGNTLSDGDRRWRSGVAAQQRGDRTAAISDYRTCLDESPDNSGCRSRIAQLTSTSSSGGPPVLIIVVAVVAGLLLVGAAGWWLLGRPEPEYE